MYGDDNIKHNNKDKGRNKGLHDSGRTDHGILCHQNMAHVFASDIVTSDRKFGDNCKFAREHIQF